MAIITYPLNDILYDATDAETYLCTRTSGVFSADDNFVASVSGAREITIGNGIAWIKNDAYAGKSVCVTDSVAVDIDTADALPRIDRIVLRFDGNANASSIAVIKGTAASNPIAPSIQRANAVYDLCLYDVLVRANATSLASSDLTNKMLDETVCGIMRDGVTGIPTAQLAAQAQDLIDQIRQALDDVLAEIIPHHASTHAADGSDPISPASIGAATLPQQKTAITSPLQDNTEYRLTNVTSLSISYPTGNFECWLRISTASSGTINISFPSGTYYLGSTPTFATGKTYELSIKDKYVAWSEVA